MRHARWLLSLTLCGVLACGSTGVLTVQQERQIGSQARAQIQRQFTLMRDRVVVTYVRRLGEALYESSAPSPFEPRFAVVESQDLNAFATFGGSIYVNTGMILAVDDVSELAGVIAHEIGHATARHLAQQFPVQQRTNFVARLLSLAIQLVTGRALPNNAGNVLLGVGARAYLTQFGREAEREADALAVEALVNGGYDPDGMVRLFEKLKEQESRGVPQFLASHPASAERIENVRALIEKFGAPKNPIETDEAKFKAIQTRIRLIQGLDTGLEEDAEQEDDDLDESEDEAPSDDDL